MSLATMLLAFLAPVIRPKLKPEKSVRERELEGEIDRLLRLNERAAGRIDFLEAERDSWRRRCEDAQARLAGDRIERRLEQRAPLQAAQYLQAQQMAAQQNMANPMAQARMLQAMNAQLAAWGQCNCVPARHDMLLGAIGGA